MGRGGRKRGGRSLLLIGTVGKRNFVDRIHGMSVIDLSILKDPPVHSTQTSQTP